VFIAVLYIIHVANAGRASKMVWQFTPALVISFLLIQQVASAAKGL
jgi:hypothetical protein